MKTLIRILLPLLLVLVSSSSMAGWYDSNAAGTAPDWGLSSADQLTCNSQVNQTVTFDVGFNTLLTNLGASGTLDVNSPRVVHPNDTLVNQQEFSDIIYSGAIDPLNSGRGQIKFIAADSGVPELDIFVNIKYSVNSLPSITIS